MKVLVFDPLEGGHRGVFLRHLHQSVQAVSDADFSCLFYVSGSSAQELDPGGAVSEVRIAEPLVRRGVAAKWELMRRLLNLCEVEQPDLVFLMALGDLEWPLLFIPCPVPFSAILFVQYPEMPAGWKRRFKEVKTQWLLRRNRVRTVYLLNGAHSLPLLHTVHASTGTEFSALPDPVVPFTSLKTVPGRDGTNTGRIRLLYFGAISQRKGWDVLAGSLARLPGEVLNRLSLQVIGRPENVSFFEDHLEHLKRLPSLDWSVRLEFVSDQEVEEVFCSSDVVLLPYRRTEYSSGVLGLAAQAEKPVIGPEGGLLGRLIQENGLGIVTRIDENSFSEALLRAVRSELPFDREGAKHFVHASRPEAFGSVLVSEFRELAAE